MSTLADTVILDTSHSPYSRLSPISLKNISLDGGFWYSSSQLNSKLSIPTQFKLLDKTGRLDNFRRVGGTLQKPFQGYVFNDSDVYKWLEAACWAMASSPDGELGDWIDQTISLIARAQDKDGYLNTYFSLDKIRQRWMNLQDMHEMYCAGHMIQAAIAHQRVTGEARLLRVAIRLADHICKTFGPSQVEGVCGHPEIEMALVELYRATGDQKYLEQAALFVNRRGRGLLGGGEILLDHMPIREMDQLAGHAVRALYLCSGAADLVLETGESPLKQALERLWHNMVTQQVYVTGGVGARYEGEAFGQPFELPNARAYAETCAAIANVMWNWRMLQMDASCKYADLLEWALYNAVLPGISVDATSYFYVNPLADDGSHRRSAWFDCACCPPNIARTIASYPGYLYSTSKEGIWVHQYAESTATIQLADGTSITLRQITSYPWDGHIRLRICEIPPSPGSTAHHGNNTPFGLFFRLPAWTAGRKIAVKINGKAYRHESESGTYLEIQREWRTGDEVDLELPMDVKFIESHPLLHENSGRLAISRGPLVYCLEAADNPRLDLSRVSIDPSSPVRAEYVPELLGGITRLHLPGFKTRTDPAWENTLYHSYRPANAGTKGSEVELISIPYFAWANRYPGSMAVWHRRR